MRSWHLQQFLLFLPLDGLHPLNKCPMSSQSPRGGEASAEISAAQGRAAARGGTTPEPSEHKGHVTKTKLRRRPETPRRQVLGLGGNSQMLGGTLGRGHPTAHTSPRKRPKRVDVTRPARRGGTGEREQLRALPVSSPGQQTGPRSHHLAFGSCSSPTAAAGLARHVQGTQLP